METSPILSAWQSGNTEQLAQTSTAELVFSSPVADYAGRDAALHMIRLISEVLENPGQTHRWSDGPEAFSRFTAHAAGDEVQGVLHEERDPAGRLVHVTLFLRPYSTLRAAMGAMRDLLDRSPLPAQSS
ncbi:hypothetical protein [Nocardia sp. NPDC051750]|uniref:hypothetical protein n=1 Tax=Nocardia sp. NPDC051750 TaxID=3364325 RepID=UPI00378C40A5